MANKHENLTSLFTDIADAIREKTGGTATLIADDFPEAIRTISTSEDLNAEIAVQEEKLAAQDILISNMMTALEGKAAGGVVKNTKTIYLDWSQDEETIGSITYISSEGELITVDYWENINIIEAEHGIVFALNDICNFTNGFQQISTFGFGYGYNMWQTQVDGETIYFVSSSSQ